MALSSELIDIKTAAVRKVASAALKASSLAGHPNYVILSKMRSINDLAALRLTELS